MEIKIGEYTIKSDEHQLWIERERISVKGKPYAEKVAGYSPTFEQLCDSFCKHKYRGSDVTTVKEALEALKEAEKETLEIIDAYLEGVKMDAPGINVRDIEGN